MSSSCPKSGIKIHSSNNSSSSSSYNPYLTPITTINQSSSYNPINQSQSSSSYNPPPLSQSRLSAPVSFQHTKLSSLDLDLNNYSLPDLFHLFNIDHDTLTEENLKFAKSMVLKMHPDKSHLESKYFLFFSNAYKRLFSIWEFQNKATRNRTAMQRDHDEFFDEANQQLVKQTFTKNQHFDNTLFNKTFEKFRVEDPQSQGHGDWLKSNEGIMDMEHGVTKGNMNEVFERKKQQIQAVSVYTGVSDMFASTFGGSVLDGSEDFSTNEYTDLKQAYTETLIPVTEADFHKMPKFNSVNEYKSHREKANVAPLNKADAERLLYQQEQDRNKQSSALAFKYAQEAEKVKEKQRGFWAEIRHLTNF